MSARRNRRILLLSVMLCLVMPGLVISQQLEEDNMTAATKQNSSKKKDVPLRSEKSALIEFQHSAFPYHGESPLTGKPFMDYWNGSLRGHTSARGGVYFEYQTYSDRRSLLYFPKGFDITRPVMIIVFFHGNKVKLERDVIERQQVTRQLAESGLNAVLVCPQLAVDAVDSSAGRFWEPGFFTSYVDEAVQHLSKLHGSVRAKSVFRYAPVIIAAYSGGYVPAAYAADVGDINGRVKGMILFDSPYGDEDVFTRWITRRKPGIFFLSVHGVSSREWNQRIQQMLDLQRVSFRTDIPKQLSQGTIAFYDTADLVEHEEYMTRSWEPDPLKNLLARIPGFLRTESTKKHK